MPGRGDDAPQPDPPRDCDPVWRNLFPVWLPLHVNQGTCVSACC